MIQMNLAPYAKGITMTNSYKICCLSSSIDICRLLIGYLQVFYLLYLGLSLADIGILKVVYSAVVFLVDIPTGTFADLYGNKKSVLFGIACLIVYYACLMFAPVFLYLIIAEIFYGLGLCLISGAIDTWLSQAAKNEYPETSLKVNHFYHLRSEISALGNLILAPLGVYLLHAFSTMKLLYVISAFAMLSLFLITLSIKNYHQTVKFKNEYFSLIKMSVLSHKSCLIFIVLSCMITAIYQPIYYYWQPLFLQLAHPDTFNHLSTITNQQILQYSKLLCIVFVAYNLFIFLANKFVRTKLLKITKQHLLGISSVLISSFSILSLLITDGFILSVLFFSVCHSSLSLFMTITETGFINDYSGKSLATILSIANVMARAFSMGFLFLISMVVSDISVKPIFFIAALLGLSAALLFKYSYIRLIKFKH